jgi:LDH2 family malate/lactate/ureidoglycolate dehydrogenase
MMSDNVRLTLSEVETLTRSLLLTQGFNEAHAASIAKTVTAAERDECRHHGLFRVPFYINGLKSGLATGDREPTFTELTPSAIRLDAHYGYSNLALERGDQPLADRAMKYGIAALAINHAHSIVALWPEVERLAERGLVGFSFVSASPYVAPAGGTKPLFGTNPIAFAWPRPGNPPYCFDQASSASARGEIQIRLRDGRKLPDGWAIGPDGEATNDPKQALLGAQLPFGGFKGSALATMIELLAGPLVGDFLSYESGEYDTASTGTCCGGQLVIAIDPVLFSFDRDRKKQLDHGERLFQKMLEQDGVRLPSDRRYEARRRTVRDGIELPRSLYDTLVAFAEGTSSASRNDYEGDHIVKDKVV